MPLASRDYNIAILVVLWGLFLKPPAFEYRKKIDNPKWRNFWDWMLVLGSIIPIVVMGVAVDNLYLGFPISYDDTARLIYGTVTNGEYQSMWITLLHLLTPFALLIWYICTKYGVNVWFCLC